MCHGCFDLVHPGHVRHLQEARRLGDRLLVTVTGDAAMRKGVGRPLIPQGLRAAHLAALACVDWVAVCDQPTAVDALRRLRPDVFVKGREYEGNRDPRFRREREAVEACGGRVVFTSGDLVMSSTALAEAVDASSPVRRAARRIVERAGLGAAELVRTVDGFRGRRVLVVGETIADTYVDCARPHVAGEAPLMTLCPGTERRFDGGAAIIARHLAAMGARPVLLTPLPAAARGMTLRLDVEGIEVHPVEVIESVPEKRRYLVGTTKVMKLDAAVEIVLDARQRRDVVGRGLDLAATCEAVIIADYGHGFLTAPMLETLCGQARGRPGLIVGDVSGARSNLLAMRGVDLLAPAEPEVRDALNDHVAGLSAVTWRLLEGTGAAAAIVTLGAGGLIAFERRPDVPDDPDAWGSALDAAHLPAMTRHAVDALGCGDALTAATTLALLAGAPLGPAAVIGSAAAALEAERLGNEVIATSDLCRRLTGTLGAAGVPDGAGTNSPC